MNAPASGNRSIFGARRIPVATAIAVASLGLIMLSLATARRPEPAAPDPSNAGVVEEPQIDAQTPWNPALGNVVFFAPELGLQIKAPDNASVERERVAVRVEAQLLGLRQLYRQRSEKDPDLLGELTLRVTVGNGGQVVQVQELSASISDKDFRNAVAAEASKWNFNAVAPEGTSIDCPLLFIREGMDITTLVNWERRMGGARKLESHEPTAPKAQAAK